MPSTVSALEARTLSAHSLSSCLPLPLPTLNLTGGVSSRKVVCAVAGASTNSRKVCVDALYGRGGGWDYGGGVTSPPLLGIQIRLHTHRRACACERAHAHTHTRCADTGYLMQVKANSKVGGGGGKTESGEGDVIRNGDLVCDGAFAIHQRLGTGGFGTVYMATDIKEGRRIALKMQRPGKKLCQVALDEVALLTLVTHERARLLHALPPRLSAATAAKTAAAVAVAAGAAGKTARVDMEEGVRAATGVAEDWLLPVAAPEIDAGVCVCVCACVPVCVRVWNKKSIHACICKYVYL